MRCPLKAAVAFPVASLGLLAAALAAQVQPLAESREETRESRESQAGTELSRHLTPAQLAVAG